MIIDGHAHIYEYLTGYGARGEFRPLGGGKGIWANGEVEQFFPAKYGDKGFHAEALLGVMEENGVDHAVLLQGGNYGFHNDYAAEAAGKYPDKFTAVGTLDPYGICALEILDSFISRYGIRALKFECSQTWGLSGYHPGLRLDDPRFAPLFSRANDLGMTIVIDMGPMGTDSFQIDPLRNLLKAWPRLRFVMTHCFFPCADGRNEERLSYMKELVCDRFVFDIANLPPIVWPEAYPYPTQQAFLRKAKDILGAERMIWGTDVPGVLNRFSYSQLLNYVAESGIFTQKELEYVLARTAMDLYHIKIGCA